MEFATLGWVKWFNNRRLLAPIGNVSPTEFEQQYYLAQEAPVMTARVARSLGGGAGPNDAVCHLVTSSNHMGLLTLQQIDR